MMIKLTLLLNLFINQAHASCDTGAIVMKKETTFGISIGGSGGSSTFGESSSINVPFSINNEQACFKKVTKLSVTTEDKGEKFKGKLIITPLRAEFENVPDAHTKQYIFADKSDDPLQTKFFTMSFVCSGEIPLSIEATSDSYKKILMDSARADVSVTTVFATGAAADNLKHYRKNMGEDEAFKFFAEKFGINQGTPFDESCCGQRIPSILTSTSIKSMTDAERAITSTFTTLGATIPNGCSKEFSSRLSNYLIENYERNDSLLPFNVSKKWFKNDLVLDWKK